MSVTPQEVRKRHQRVKCHATLARSNGERPCGNYAINGSTVCRFHGGATPQVKKKARERLMDMIDPAVTHLQKIIEKDTTSDADRLRAIQMLLDRTGYGIRSEVVIEAKPWEKLVDGNSLLVEVDLDLGATTDVPVDRMAEAQAAHDQWVYDHTPDAPVIPLRALDSHPVAASPTVPEHLL